MTDRRWTPPEVWRFVHLARRGLVALRCGGSKDEDLAEADAIYDDARDLLANLGTSPFGAA